MLKKLLLFAPALLSGCATVSQPPGGLGSLPAVGTVEPRYLSYNVEMVELTGGRFWRPYGSPGTDRYEYRPPLDLSDPKLRAAAKALGPAYVRYSGTWANATWFADKENPPKDAPAGFDTVLTRQQWRAAVDFAAASNAKIVTSVATSPGARDIHGAWQPDTAARWFAYTREIGGSIAASEFANEPNMISLTKPPAGYSSAAYRQDYATFANWLRRTSPATKLLAPGVAELGEPTRALSLRNKTIEQYPNEEIITPDLLKPDGFSFHFYGGGSERCGGKFIGHTIDKALGAPWLDSIDAAIARVSALRNAVAPGVGLWDTESGETACGGNPWASTFADSFRFVDTLGRSARQGVRVFIHNTLAASDYALLDPDHTPRPNFWAAVLWKRTMGTTVLAAPTGAAPALRIYAHCLPNRRGGVGLAAVNPSDAALPVTTGRGHAWVLEAPALDSKTVTVSGMQPGLSSDGTVTGLGGSEVTSGVTVPARSIAFVSVPDARNPACR